MKSILYLIYPLEIFLGKNISNKTPLGMEAKSYMDKGQLVPDELTIEIVKDRLSERGLEKWFFIRWFSKNCKSKQRSTKMNF